MTEALRARLRQRFGLAEGGAEHRPALQFMGEASEAPGLSRLTFRAVDGSDVRGWLMAPEMPPPWPVVLVIHAHGAKYEIGADELIHGRPAQPAALGPDLTARGMAALCVDLPCFGLRRATSESAASKAALWRGGSLAGEMLAELAAQVDWLQSDPRFRADRIGAYGLSMGATLGYWLAAVDPRITALAQLCCLADIDRLIDSGAHDLHGPYLTVPGLPLIARNGQIAGLIAPRPQLVCLGAQDPLTPPEALAPALGDLRKAYGDSAALSVHIDPTVGHVETPEMRRMSLAFLSRTLG